MRLTLELLQQAPQSLNPALHRQLQLRGFKWPGSSRAMQCDAERDESMIQLDFVLHLFLRIPTIATWLKEAVCS